MAIVDMTRFTLTAFLSERQKVLQTLQVLSDVHFEEQEVPETACPDLIHLDDPAMELAALRERISRTRRSIEAFEKLESSAGLMASFNSALPVLPYARGEKMVQAEDLEPINRAVFALLSAKEDMRQKMDELRAERRRIRRYIRMDAPLEELSRTKKTVALLGTVPIRWYNSLSDRFAELERAYLEPLGADEKYRYIFVLYDPQEAETEAVLQAHAFTEESFSYQGTPEEAIDAIDQELASLEKALEDNTAQLRELSCDWLDHLRLAYDVMRNAEVRLISRTRILRGDRVFILKAYVPTDEADTLEELFRAVMEEPYELQMERVQKNDPEVDKVPVLLRNRPLIEPFESVVTTFATPRYNEIDPTGVMMPWYSLSFGMMMGDAGYGLVILILTTLALRLFRLKEGMKNTIRFFQILSIPTIVAGLCYGSVFAFSFPSLISPSEESTSFLLLSFIIGAGMLLFALGVKGYMAIRDGDPKTFFFDVLAWYFALIGIFLTLAAPKLGLAPWAKTAGVLLMILGMVLIVLFSARDEKNPVARVGWGAYNLYGMTSWLGDLVSFARIAALALSGGFIGYAVNLISGMVFDKGVVGALFGVVIMLFFHAFNIFLSGLSAYVHSMRLAYVEFFGKFYSGGGIPFQKYRAEGTYYDLR